MSDKKSVSRPGNKNWVRNIIITLLTGAVIGFLVYIIIKQSSKSKSGFEDVSGTTYALTQLDWKVPCDGPHRGQTTMNGVTKCRNYKLLESGYTLTINADKMIIRQDEEIQATIDIMDREDVRVMWGVPAVKYTIGPVRFTTDNPELQELHRLNATELYMTSNDFAHMLAEVVDMKTYTTGFLLAFQDLSRE
jgi:hypothetical protein